MSREETIRWGPFQKRLKLTEAQASLLSKQDPRLVVSGPPGSGKSVVLLLKALEWLKAGCDVIVFGVSATSMPSCRLLHCQLSEAYKESQGGLFPKDRTWGLVKFEHVVMRDARNIEPALSALLKHGNPLYVVMDDFLPEDGFAVETTKAYLRELMVRVPDVHLWMSTWYLKPELNIPSHVLAVPLRYPLPVLQEVSVAVEVIKALGVIPETHGYDRCLSLVDSLPEVIHVRHNGRGDAQWPVNSEKCGKQVAKILRSIGVGGTGASRESYQFRDVFIISRNAVDPQRPPAAFVRGLEASGIPTQVFGCSSGYGQVNLEKALDDIILAKENKVTVMNYTAARGLDRDVVVCLTGAGPNEGWELTDREIAISLQSEVTLSRQGPMGTESFTIRNNPTKVQIREAKTEEEHTLKSRMELNHRLQIWSRASHQLIVVHLRKGMEGGPSGSENYGGRKCVIL